MMDNTIVIKYEYRNGDWISSYLYINPSFDYKIGIPDRRRTCSITLSGFLLIHKHLFFTFHLNSTRRICTISKDHFFAFYYIYIFPRASTTNIDKGKLLWGKNCTNWAQWMNTKLSIKIAVFMNASCVVLSFLSNSNKRHYANEITFFALEQIELRKLKLRVFFVILSNDEIIYAIKTYFLFEIVSHMQYVISIF